jgi:hypothetical protein
MGCRSYLEHAARSFGPYLRLHAASRERLIEEYVEKNNLPDEKFCADHLGDGEVLKKRSSA